MAKILLSYLISHFLCLFTLFHLTATNTNLLYYFAFSNKIWSLFFLTLLRLEIHEKSNVTHFMLKIHAIWIWIRKQNKTRIFNYENVKNVEQSDIGQDEDLGLIYTQRYAQSRNTVFLLTQNYHFCITNVAFSFHVRLNIYTYIELKSMYEF